jgi:hypothetical protein
MLEVEQASLDLAGAARLEQIRASMGGAGGAKPIGSTAPQQIGSAAPKQVTSGNPATGHEQSAPQTQRHEQG